MTAESISVDLLKDAMIAEMVSDVLKIKEAVEQIDPMVKQLEANMPGLFDVLRAGLIDTLEQINQGILEAGGERIEYVKGQLHVYMAQEIEKVFAANSDRVERLVEQFERQNNAAAKNLRAQYEEVAAGMEEISKRLNKNSFPTWAKITIPLAFVIAIASSAIVSWQLASYKEAEYMRAYMQQLETVKAKQNK